MKLFVFTFIAIATQLITINANIAHFALPEPCQRSDSNLRNCVLERIQETLPYILKNGIPEYNLPTIDPLNIPLMPFDITINNFININGSIANLNASGLSKYVINDLQADGQNYVLEIESFHPYLGIELELDVSVDVLIPFQGYLKGNITDITSRTKLSFKIVEKEGVKYFTINKLKMKRTIEGCRVDIVSKDPEHQALGDFAKKFFNRHSKQVAKQANTYLGELLENFASVQIEKVLSSVPADRLLLK